MVKRIFQILFLAILAYAAYWFFIKRKQSHPDGPKPVPIAVKNHTVSFNNKVDSMVNAYLAIKDALVEWDTAGAKKATAVFIQRIDSFPIDEMKNDTATIIATVKANLGDIRSNAVSLLAQPNITEMRRDFQGITEQMYPSFFKAINYEGPTLYYDLCPMAFDDSVGANWISNSAAIVNPYLGKHSPKYQSGMLHCGEVKDSITAKK